MNRAEPLTVQDSSNSTRTIPFEPAPLFRKSALQDDLESADARGKRIAILIVAYNAATTLLPVLKRITPNVWRNVEEVIVMDDASQDATYEAALGMKLIFDEHLAKLTVIKHPKNLGYGGNQIEGYRYVIEKGFDVVVLLHGDGQYAPEILSHLYAPLVRGDAEAVFGSRMMKTYGGPLKGGMPLYKFVGNRILSLFENWMLDLKLTEFHSGYRAYSVAALKKINMSAMTRDFHFDTEIIIKFKHQSLRIMEVPIPTYYGDEICRVVGLKYAKDVVKAVWHYRRTVGSVRSYPEFQEYWAHYSLKETRYSSHYFGILATTGSRRVLDIGCGNGYIAKKLVAHGCEVVGVDNWPNPECRDAMAEFHRCDLNDGLDAIKDKLPPSSFERVLLLDVLEHLHDPDRVLRQAAEYLDRGGRLVVSLPNVANITIRLGLLFGQWNYTDRGILDRTHVRFFTRKSARQLLERNGYRVVETKVTNMPVELVLGLRPDGIAMKVISPILGLVTRMMPGLMGYQVFLVAKKADN